MDTTAATTTTTTITTTTNLPRTPRYSRSHSHSRAYRQTSTPAASQPARPRLDITSPSSSKRPLPQTGDFSDNKGFLESPYERLVHPTQSRSQSPDGQSRVPASSSTAPGGPQLRKKPKSLAIQSKPRSKSSGAAATPSAPGLAYTQEEALLLSPTQNPANSSKPPSRTDANPLQQHSPVYKRPPASHSSYGVETTCGPPPSYTTRRTYSQERIKKLDRNTILWTPSHDIPSSDPEQLSSSETPPSNSQQSDPTALVIQSPPETTEGYIDSSPTQMDPMSNVTLRGRHRYESEYVEDENKGSSSDERKSEDLFLNIAKVDAARAPATRTDRKRSRMSIPFLSGNRSNHETKSSPINSQYNPDQRSSQVEEPRYYSKRSSIGQHLAGALSKTDFLDGGRPRDRAAESTPDTEKPDYPFGRRNSVATVEHSKPSQRPSHPLRGQRSVAESSFTNPSRIEEHIATESTVSTTAPSTVWDELDDLKSRIRKLELTGKLPPSSAAAMSSAERPRTATTVATTMSASPRPKTAGVSQPSAVDGIPSSIHPLLHEALGNAKQVLSQEVYSKLYATASDALQLATMVSNEPHSTSHSINANHERQIRRRTENMCRGITELAIALSTETKGTSLVQRPISRDQANPPSAMLRSRRYSNDPGDRSMPSRVSSRLDGRRTSLVMGGTSPGTSSTDPVLPPLPGLRLGRSSTITRSRRGPGAFDGADEEMEASPSIRPVSRAMTELGAYRRPPRDFLESSREFTSQHPMPRLDTGLTSTPLSNNMGVNFMSRRKYTSPATTTVGGGHENSPATPHDAMSPREGWGKISIVPGEGTPGDVASEAGRAGPGRRSLGFASRIGSSMGSRLRSARTDRGGRESFGEIRHLGDVTPSQASEGYMYAS